MKNYIGKKVIIRADRAGVFFGELKSVEPLGDKLMVELQNCRRLWRWDGACSLSQLAKEGTKKPDGCKFSVSINSIVISGVIEILLCTSEAINSIEGVSEWKI